MTRFIFVKHGEPDYTFLQNKNFKLHAIDLDLDKINSLVLK